MINRISISLFLLLLSISAGNSIEITIGKIEYEKVAPSFFTGESIELKIGLLFLEDEERIPIKPGLDTRCSMGLIDHSQGYDEIYVTIVTYDEMGNMQLETRVDLPYAFYTRRSLLDRLSARIYAKSAESGTIYYADFPLSEFGETGGWTLY